MRYVKLELTPEEITLLASLASDQLFRREFIDPKMPGYKADPAEVRMGKELVGRLRLMIAPARAENGSSRPAETGRAAANPSKRSAGSADAL
jgi:hypothetical protein